MKNLWATDGGIYLGMGVTPFRDPPHQSILDAPWSIDSDRFNFYPNTTRADEPGDRHVLTVGPNGSGKTRRLLIPNLFRLLNWSMVVVDVKGGLAVTTAIYRASQEGHRAVVLDPFAVMEKNYPRLVEKYPFLRSHGHNPTAALDPTSDDFPDEAMRLAEAMVPQTGQQELHWSETAQDLVAALIMYVRLAKPRTGSLGDVRAHLGETATEFRSTVQRMRAAGVQHDCEALIVKAGRFAEITGDNKELNSVFSTALTQTRWLDSRPIKADLARGTLDFGSIKQEPTTVYMILPPRYLATHATWLRVMITSILLPLLRSVDDAKIPVLFMLDEFSQLGHMAVIENNMALMREYGVKLWPVFQDFAQAKSLYKDRWESFVGNAGVMQAFAPQDVTTRDYLSQFSGQRLYWLKTGGTSSSQNVGPQSSQSVGSNEARQYLQGPVFWPQGLGAMGRGQSVLYAGGRRVRTYLPDPEDAADTLGLRSYLQWVRQEASA